MEYDIKPLSAELARPFADYPGNLGFHRAPRWASCFCRYYYTDCSQGA